MSSKPLTPATILTRLSQAVLALKEPSCPINTITVDQVSYTNAELQKKIEAVLAPYQAVVDAKQQYDNAVQTRSAVEPDARAFTGDLYAALGVVLGADNANLSDYGGKPRKARAKLTSEQKALAAEKARATRKARHTMGKKQKAAIHGTVPAAGSTPSGG
jgi:hypothetical protein